MQIQNIESVGSLIIRRKVYLYVCVYVVVRS